VGEALAGGASKRLSNNTTKFLLEESDNKAEQERLLPPEMNFRPSGLGGRKYSIVCSGRRGGWGGYWAPTPPQSTCSQVSPGKMADPYLHLNEMHLNSR